MKSALKKQKIRQRFNKNQVLLRSHRRADVASMVLQLLYTSHEEICAYKTWDRIYLTPVRVTVVWYFVVKGRRREKS